MRVPIGSAAAWVAIAVTAGMALSIGALSGRGFDVTDEGYYLLSAQYPSDSRAQPTAANHYTALLWRLAAEDVATMRRLGLLLAVGGASFFAAALLKLLAALEVRLDAPARRMLVAATVATGLLQYFWFLPTPSYNSLNTLCLEGCLACTMLGLAAAGDAASRRARAAVLGAGVFAGVSAFAKFPTGLALFALVPALLLLWPGPPPRWRVAVAGAFCAGVAFAVLTHFTLLQSYGEWRDVFARGIELRTTLDPRDTHFVQRYWEQLENAWRDAWRPLRPVALGAVAYVLVVRFGWIRRRGVEEALFAAAVLWVTYRCVREGLHIGGSERYGEVSQLYVRWLLLAALLSGAGLLVAGSAAERTHRRARTLVALLLAGAPLVGAAGTSNSIWVNALYNLAPWGALLWLALYGTGRLGALRCAPAVAGLVLVVLCASQVLSGAILRPYRLNGTLLEQTEPVTLGVPPSRLLLDPPTARFIAALRDSAATCGLRPGADVLALYHVPGLVFALGARSPGVAWYFAGYPGQQHALRFALDLIPPERRARAFLLERRGPDFDAAITELRTRNFAYPENYELCMDRVLPYPWAGERVLLWRPRT